jgi:paraquat-inducible protein B
MKTKVSPAIVGVFVIGAFALGIVALLAFGGVHFFSKPQRFMVYFEESISGLDPGAPVKLGGLRIGRVVGMNIRYDDKNNRSVAAVECELSRQGLTDAHGTPIDVTTRAPLQKLIDDGLRAQLNVQSYATGLVFVELDFLDPKQNPAPPPAPDEKYIVIPSVLSPISGFQNSLTEILTNLKKIDFAGLSRGLTALMADAQTKLDALDLKGAVEQWKKTGAQVESLAASPEFKRTFDNLNAAVTDLRGAITRVEAQVEPTSKDLRETLTEAKRTLASFNDTATTASKFINRNAVVGDELANTLQHLNDAAESVKRLADFLERNPNALITGKKPPE